MLTLKPPERILVIRLSSLGDVVLTTPVLGALKSAWPHASLTVLTKGAFAAVFQGNPHVNEVAVFEERGGWGWAKEIRERCFDVVIDLHDTPRSRFWSALSGASRRVRYDKRAMDRRRLVWFKKGSPRLASGTVDRYLETLTTLGVPKGDRVPRLFLLPEERLSEPWDRRLGSGPFLAVAPGALHSTKRWLPERFAQAADELVRDAAWPVILLGAHADQSAAEEVLAHLRAPAQNLVGQTTLRELMLILQRCALLLSNDSGALHAGAALGVPAVAVFGPTVKEFGFFPTATSTRVVEVPGLSCRPCSLHGSARCPEGHFRCMRDIPVREVVAAARETLAAPAGTVS